MSFWGNGFDVVGAAPQMQLMQRSAAAPPAVAALVNAAAAGQHPLAGASPQGVSTPKEEMDFLPFDEVLNDGSFDATHSELRFESFPQRPFRGERVMITAFSATIADPASNVVIDPAMYVGAVQIGATQGRAGIAAYAPTSFGARLTWPASGQGTRVFVPLSVLVALTGGDKIACNVQCIGQAVR